MPADNHVLSMKIIDAIKQHPVLYISDVKGPAVKLQEFRQRIWAKISDELGLESTWMRLKWKNLRDTYCRILKAKIHSPGVKRKKWTFEDEMSFLKFSYEPDYQPQYVELTDEYIADIMGHNNGESLLEQLEGHNNEDYTDYLEILEETTSDPIMINENTCNTEVIDNNPVLKSFHHISQSNKKRKTEEESFEEQIQSDLSKKIKLDNNKNHKAIDVSNTFGILNPEYNIDNLKKSNNKSNDSSSNKKEENSDSIISNIDNLISEPSSLKIDQIFSQPLGKTSIELFFSSMAQTVKLLPPEVQAEIKMAVCKIVTEAEVKHSKSNKSKTVQQFYAPPGMIPKLVLIPCNVVDNPSNT